MRNAVETLAAAGQGKAAVGRSEQSRQVTTPPLAGGRPDLDQTPIAHETKH